MTKKSNNQVTGQKKRELIDSARKKVFLWTAIASAMAVLAIVVGYFIVKEIAYDQARLSAKYATLSTIRENITAADELEKNIQALIANGDLAKAKANSSDSNYKVILDALPVTGDSTVLGSSLLQSIIPLSGVKVKALTASSLSEADPSSLGLGPESTGQGSLSSEGLSSVTYNFEVTGSYQQIQNMFRDMERSIRPVNVTSFEIKASDEGDLTVDSIGESYFSSKKTIELTEKVVER